MSHFFDWLWQSIVDGVLFCFALLCCAVMMSFFMSVLGLFGKKDEGGKHGS